MSESIVQSRPIFVTEERSVDNVEIAASSTIWSSINVTKSGYRPLTVTGYYIAIASTSGSNNSMVRIYNIRLSWNTVSLAFRNQATSRARIKMIVDILYVKDPSY